MRIPFMLPLRHPADAGSGGGATETEDAAAKAAADTAAAAKTGTETKTVEPAPGEKKADQKTPEQIAAETKSGAAGKSQPPDTYALKVPAGVTLSADDLKLVEQQARKYGLSNEDAQAMLDEQLELISAQSEAYKAAALADPDYGGEKLADSQKLANSVIDRFRPKGHARRDNFLAFINRAGASNHPEVLAFLTDIGRAMGEDTPVAGKVGGGDAKLKSQAEKLFGDSTAG